MSNQDNRERYIRDISDAFSGTYLKYNNLELTPMTLADLEEMGSWPRFEESALSWANFPVRTEELRRSWFSQQQKGHLQWIMIRDIELDQLIARCSITEPLSGNSIMYGIVVRPDKLGQGLGTLITRLMIQYIFAISNKETIWLESRYDNIRAHHTWEKIGFINLGMHYRREVFGRYDRYIGYKFDRSQIEDAQLPEIEVLHLD